MGGWFIASPESAATITGLPTGFTRGNLAIHAGPAGYSYVTQVLMQSGPRPVTYTRTMLSAELWSEWQTMLTTGRILAEGTRLDDWSGHERAGSWYVPTGPHAATIVGLPSRLPGNLLVLSGPPGYSYTAQVYLTSGNIDEQAVYWRSLAGVGAWWSWKALGTNSGGGGGDPYEPVAAGMKNADLLDMLVQRKGGPIGTGGRAGFALRVDHGTDAFQSDLGPLVKKYGIPLTMAVYSKQREVNPDNNGVEWSIVEQWHRTHGMSFGNHSDDHLDKPDAGGWEGGTIGSAAALKSLMPTVPVEQYIPHGSVGFDRYGGFNAANSHDAIVGTLAGRMALSSHALVSGYRGGQFRPLHGRPMQGLAHWTMEEATPAEFKAMLDEAISEKVGLAVMFHPEFIGRTNKMTWEQVEECLAYVAQKRDEGVLIPLTLDGLACADSGSSFRHDLHLDPLLSTPASWTGSGFTLTAGAFTSSSAGASVYHDVPMTRKTWARGGVREAQWKVNVSSTATVTVSAASANGTWTTDRTVQLATGQRKIHLPFGIPLNQSQPIRTKLTVVSGGLTISESHLYSS
ncbi:hypothetical protein BLJ79_21655 [Arthrobacter sp. UCD-GKA]|nr:hypothetical protein BLJ79_21655 [Arthrobacter sp. UCD-GKA]